jgi:hypothetical protein
MFVPVRDSTKPIRPVSGQMPSRFGTTGKTDTRLSAHRTLAMVTRDPRAAAMTEAELMEAIRALVADLGLFAHHGHDSRRSWGPGFPRPRDRRPRRLHLARVQDRGREPLGRTAAVGPSATAAGQRWSVWRPRRLLDGTIGRELAGLAAIQGALFAMPGNAGSAR